MAFLKFSDFDDFLAWCLVRRLAVTDERLYRLEMGVFFFCRRQADLSLGLPWHDAIAHQAKGEYAHAQIFASQKLPDYTELDGRAFPYSDWNGLQLNLSGKAIASKFFGNKSAGSYKWQDKLAFMWVLERFQSAFYRELSKLRNDSKLLVISLQEKNHSDGLAPYVGLWSAIAWRIRMLLVLILLVVRPFLVNKL